MQGRGRLGGVLICGAGVSPAPGRRDARTTTICEGLARRAVLLVPKDNRVARAACEFRRKSRLHTIPSKNEPAKELFVASVGPDAID
jgi:hypothetical protein